MLSIQANLIRGGLILNITGHHQALDGTGQEQVAFLLNKACHDEAFTADEIRIGNASRADIIEFLPSNWQPDLDSRYLQRVWPNQESAPSGKSTPERSELLWTNVSFSSEALTQLKVQAHSGLSSGFVSTDDALTAFIWQSMARARRQRYPGATRTTVGRAVNPRRYLGIPETYPGYISNMAYSSLTMDELSDAPLSVISALLRSAVDPEVSQIGRTTREFATLLHRATDKNSISANENLNLDTDVMLSSWANMRCYDWDFGLGPGYPLAFRRTRHAPVPSLMFLLPRRPNGEIVVSMCVRADDLESLKSDDEFCHRGILIG